MRIVENMRVKNYSEDLQYINEPENEACTTGIVPANLEVNRKEEKRTVIVPELTSMNRFLFDHYRDDMVRFLKNMLRSGYLKEIVDFPFQNKTLYKNNYNFSEVSYWRVDRETIIADVCVDLYLNTGNAIRTWKGFLNLWFHLGEEINCSIEYLGPVEDIADGDLIRLSSYLVPILTNRQVDDTAEAIWAIHLPEALHSPDQRSAMNLAHKMGLSIQYLPVYHHQDTDSFLFFEEGELPVLARKADDEEDKEPVTAVIPAKTIVINTNCVRQEYSGFNIYHECFHYEEHYLFYRLQKMGNNDPHLIKTKEVALGEGKKINDPVYWMEKQANRGAYGLLMPSTYMQNLIYTELAKVKGCPHQGYRFQVVGEEIAQRLRIPHFRIRARMIQLGHIDARGALNYVDRHRIEPFAFDQNAWQEEQQTFIIDREEAWKLYESDEPFREEIDSGRYTYADGHIVRNDPTMLRDGINGNRLSIWANAHVDQCCLRFIRQYTQKGVGKYVFGRMNYDAEYVKQTLFYVENYTMDGETDEFTAVKKYKEDFPDSFREAFAQIRKQNKLSIERTAELMNLSDSTLKRWIKEPDDKITIDFVVTVALALKLPYWMSELLLDRAHKCLSTANRRHLALRWILRVQWNDGITAANEFLQAKGLEKLQI